MPKKPKLSHSERPAKPMDNFPKTRSPIRTVPKPPPAPDYPGPVMKARRDTVGTHEEPKTAIGRLVKFVRGGYTKG